MQRLETTRQVRRLLTTGLVLQFIQRRTGLHGRRSRFLRSNLAGHLSRVLTKTQPCFMPLSWSRQYPRARAIGSTQTKSKRFERFKLQVTLPLTVFTAQSRGVPLCFGLVVNPSTLAALPLPSMGAERKRIGRRAERWHDLEEQI